MITDGLNPLTVLLFAGTVLSVVGLALIYLIARLLKNQTLARISARVLLGGAGLYLLVLLVASVSSRSRVLAPGEEKHICEIDCHLAYSVAATTAESLGGGLIREVVTVKVRFDEQTISARRPRDATLTPNSRYVALVDDAGNQYPGSTDSLRRPLVPGESYTTAIAFEVPLKASGLRLILRNGDPETHVMIGHENSLFHRKTTFQLGA